MLQKKGIITECCVYAQEVPYRQRQTWPVCLQPYGNTCDYTHVCPMVYISFDIFYNRHSSHLKVNTRVQLGSYFQTLLVKSMQNYFFNESKRYKRAVCNSFIRTFISGSSGPTTAYRVHELELHDGGRFSVILRLTSLTQQLGQQPTSCIRGFHD